MSGRGDSELTRWVALGISLVSLVAVVAWAVRQPPPSLPSGPGAIAWIAAAVAIYAGVTLLRGERWWRLLRHGEVRAGRADAYSLVAVGYMGNNVLPLRGGDAIRTYLQAQRARSRLRDVLGTLVAERVLDVAVLLTTFGLLAYVVLRGIDVPSEVRPGIAAGALAVGIAAAALAWLLLGRTEGGRRLGELIADLAAATRRLRGGHGLQMLGFTVALWAAEAATYLAVAEATGVAMTPVEALYVISLASVFVLIPAGPGYLGTLDLAVLSGIRAIGGGGSEAVSYLLVLRLVLLGPITVAGLVLMLARYGGIGTLGASSSAGEGER